MNYSQKIFSIWKMHFFEFLWTWIEQSGWRFHEKENFIHFLKLFGTGTFLQKNFLDKFLEKKKNIFPFTIRKKLKMRRDFIEIPFFWLRKRGIHSFSVFSHCSFFKVFAFPKIQVFQNLWKTMSLGGCRNSHQEYMIWYDHIYFLKGTNSLFSIDPPVFLFQ